jgi:betaine reductase
MLPKNENIKPVIKRVSYFLAHVPSMVRHGSKPSREIMKDPSILPPLLAHLEDFNQAVAYPPNQVFIGNLDPDDLRKVPSPWYQHHVPHASRKGLFGEIMPEEEFYGMLKICDEFKLIMLEERFLREVALRLSDHPLFHLEDQKKLDKGSSLEQVRKTINERHALPLYIQGDRLIGCIQAGHEEDAALAPEILLENLASRASGALALRHLIAGAGRAEESDYLLGCGEEAIGDRYNRGGGSLSKAIGELCGCVRATGADVKAFCCGPVHAMVLAAGLVASKIFRNVVLVGGGSLPKLGMKFHGHLKHDLPILEDTLAGIAIWVGPDNGKNPVLRLDSIGKHQIGAGSAQQAILNNLVVEPLDRLGFKLTQIDKYATEMHNPEITEPQGSGNVPRTNYRTIGSFAVIRNEIKKDELDHFVEVYGMPGFSPTQGHIASAVPYLGFAVNKIMAGEMKRVMFLAKGSLFLGRMTQLSDGISFLLERNEGGG